MATVPAPLLPALLEAAPNGLLVLEPDGRVLAANRHARSMLGWSAAPTGASLLDLVADDERAPVASRLAAARAESALTRDMSEPLQLTARRAGAPALAIEASISPFNDDGTQRLLVGFSDVTARRRLEAALAQSNHDLEQFAYVASHDLQEPLRMVTSYCQLLQRRYAGRLDERADAYIAHAVDGAERMRALIDGLLEYSRAGHAVAPRVPSDLGRLADQVLADLRAQAEQAGASIERDEFPRRALVDPVAFREVLQNLLANAIKFRGVQTPVVRLSARETPDAWEISVEDKGIGIPPGDEERIFQMFQRLHTRAEYPGHGIGLALCRRMVESRGGRIFVRPTPGGGSTFTFTIPHPAG